MFKKKAALFVLLFAPVVTQAAVFEFGAILRPDNGVPQIFSGSMAHGEALVLYNDVTGDFTWSIIFQNLSSPVGGAGPTAHIHQGAAGTNGPVVIPLDSSNPGTIIDGTGLTEGIFHGAITLDAALVAPLFARELYINIHTTNFPGGEIRGQILPAKVQVIPVPAAAWLMMSAVLLLGAMRRRTA